MLKMAFPGREYLKNAYPYYAKHGFLLPVARVNRLADGLFKRRKAAQKAISQITGNTDSKAQLELLNELNIIAKE